MTINAITASRTRRWSTCFFTEGGVCFIYWRWSSGSNERPNIMLHTKSEVFIWSFWHPQYDSMTPPPPVLVCLCEGAPLFSLVLSCSQSWTALVSNGASAAHWSGRQLSVLLAVWCAETSLQSCSCKDGHGELLFLLKSQRQVSTKFIRKISRCFFSSGVQQLFFSLVLFKAFGGAAL